MLSCNTSELELGGRFQQQAMLYFILAFSLWRLLTVRWRRHSHQDVLLSRVLNWMLSRKCSRLVDKRFCALWDNNHSGLLDDTWLTCLLRGTNLLYSLLFVQHVKKIDVHDENYPGNVTEPLLKQQEWTNIFYHQVFFFIKEKSYCSDRWCNVRKLVGTEALIKADSAQSSSNKCKKFY